MIAQISSLLLIVVVAANASLAAKVPLHSTGVSSSSRQQDGYGNYAFGYDIKDGLGATNSRLEVGDGHGNKKGSYTLADIDGRTRKVEYIADGHGFRATIKTNEPGTAASAPAAAIIASPYAAPVAPNAHGLGYGAVYGLGHGSGYGIGHGPAYGLGNSPVYGSAHVYDPRHGFAYGNGHRAVYGLGHGAPYGIGHGPTFGKALYY